MYILNGQRISDGVAVGPCIILTSQQIKVKEAHIPKSRIDAELKRFRRALGKTRRDIQALRDQQEELGDVRRIVDASLNFLQDDYLVDSIEKRISEKLFTSQYAVSEAMSEIVRHLQSVDDPTFSSKVADFNDLEHRLLNHLLGGKLERVQKLSKPVIIVAEDLTPTQAATLDRDKVLGFATERGSWASHTAILARALGIPAVVAVPQVAKLVRLGSTVIIDGSVGTVIIDPDEATLEKHRNKRRQQRRRLSNLKSRRLKSETRDGEPVKICGNIETGDDISRVIEFGGQGVGLFRTEFLFLGRTELPDEETQYDHYRSAVEAMNGGTVTIRSMDFGGDKFQNDVNPEPNPFMGERAIRVSFKNEGHFREQLRAILRASAHGSMRLMFPMVMDVSEYTHAISIVDRAKAELDERGCAYGKNMMLGSMVELPSAALNSDALAREAEFLSIGSNDLTQHTLGVDRTNHRVSHLYKPYHPAVLRLISLIVDAGKKHRRPVSICGEMAGEVYYVAVLLGLGLREFSVAPPQIPLIKEAVHDLTLYRCIKLAEAVLETGDPDEAKRLLDAFS